MDTPELEGLFQHDEVATKYQTVNKVSTVGAANQWNTVLLAGLRFPLYALEPTSQ
jgi:hypothetical protein